MMAAPIVSTTAAPIISDDAHGPSELDAGLSEHSPLLAGYGANASDETPHIRHGEDDAPVVSAAFRRKTTWIVFGVAFVLMLANAMQPAVRVQIYENVICDQYYASHPEATGNSTETEARCKAHPIQEELAVVKGFEFFLVLFPTFLSSIPYARLSDRIGRKPVLALSLFGVYLSEIWSLAVCYWDNIFPIRLIWLSGLIQFIGGGNSVNSGVAHVIIGDYAEEDERTQIFLYLHAANVLSGVLGPVITAAMMESGLLWQAAITAELVGTIGLVLVIFLPETVHLRRKSVDKIVHHDGPSSANTIDKPAKDLLSRLKTVIGPFLAVASIFAHNPQALLLMLLYTPLLVARTAFATIGQIYFRNKFDISYPKSSLVLSLVQAVEAFLVLVILPTITFIMTSPRFSFRWLAWNRDRILSVASFGVLVTGHTLLGLAPSAWSAIVGLVFAALGSGVPSFLLSLLGSAVTSDQMSVVYSACLMLSIGLQYGLSPVLSVLFNRGMQLGWDWQGLPFVFVGCVMAVCLMGSFFIAKEREGEDEEA